MVREVSNWPWSSYQATAGEEAELEWLRVEWVLSAFAKRKSTTQKKYQEFVQGKGWPTPWEHLKNQVYLGTESFVTKLQPKIEADKDLSEVAKLQRRAKPLAIATYEKRSRNRNEVIIRAYQSRGYSMKELENYFGLHYSRVSRIVSQDLIP